MPLPRMRRVRCPRWRPRSSMFVPQASETRRPFSPSSTASAAWSRSNRSAVNKNVPSSPRPIPWPSPGCTLGRRTYWAGFRRDPSVNVSEPIEAAHRREPPVDRRRRQLPFLHRGAVQLNVRPRCLENLQPVNARPLKEHAQVMPVGLERSAAVTSEERHCSHLRLIEFRLRLRNLHHHAHRSQCRHR